MGVSAIQVILKTDQNCTVTVEQSSTDGGSPNWDIVDTYNYFVGKNFGITVQAIASYVRVTVTNLSTTTATTFLRLQTILCPIIEAVPRSLSVDGRFLTASGQLDLLGFHGNNTPMSEVRTAQLSRVCGTSFGGPAIDTKYWTTAASGTGASIAQSNAQLLFTSGTAGGATVTAYTAQRARYIGGTSSRWRGVMQLDAGTVNNTRRFGIGFGASMPTITDGAWFQLSGTTFSIVTMKNTTATTVNSGSFNGDYGLSFDPGTTAKTYEIYWTNSSVWFIINDRVLHTVSASSATWSSTMGFYGFMDSINSGAATSVTMASRVATIYRLGKSQTEPLSLYQPAAVTASVIRSGPGVLRGIVNGDNVGTVIFYDALTATNTIASIDLTRAIGSIPININYYTGLTYTTTGTPKLTIIYE